MNNTQTVTTKLAKHERAFTLVEMLISLAIFAVVSVVAMGAFLKIIEANKKSQAIKVAVNNLNFAFEAMSRDLRISSNFVANNNTLNSWSSMPGPTDSPSGGSVGVGYVNSSTGSKAAYRYNASSHTLEKADQATAGNGNNIVYYPIVSVKDLKIENLKFYVHNADGTGGQPYVFITAKVSAGTKASDEVEFVIQTTVSQRLIN